MRSLKIPNKRQYWREVLLEKKILILLVLCLVLAPILRGYSEENNFFYYQGRLSFPNGNARIGEEFEIRFSLWKTSDWVAADKTSDGKVVTTAGNYGGWQEEVKFKTDEKGVFSVKVGGIEKLPKIEPEKHKYLQVEIKGVGQKEYELLDPTGDNGLDGVDRQALGSSPFSQVSGEAKSLPEFNVDKQYKKGQVAIKGDELFRAKVGVGNGNFDVTQWESLSKKSKFRGLLKVGIKYEKDDLLLGEDNQLYMVGTEFTATSGEVKNNIANIKLVSKGAQIDDYDGRKSYGVGDVIVRNGQLYYNTKPTKGTESSPEGFDVGKWSQWRPYNHYIVSNKEEMLKILSGAGVGQVSPNDTLFRKDNGVLYRYKATDGTNDSVEGDWHVVYDASEALDSSRFYDMFGVKDYDGAKAYKKGEMVLYNGGLYQVKEDVGEREGGVIKSGAGVFDRTKMKKIKGRVSDYVLKDLKDFSRDPSIPKASEVNQKEYYIVSRGSSSGVSYGNLESVQTYGSGDMIINIDGTKWTHIRNSGVKIASKVEAETSITGLKDDGTEKVEKSIINDVFMTPLRTLQQILHNRIASLFQIRDATDQTKKLQFNLSGLTSGVIRELKVPDEDITIAGQNRIGAREYGSTETYIRNQLVLYGGELWRNIEVIKVGEDFNEKKWQRVGGKGTVSWEELTSNKVSKAYARYILDSTKGGFEVSLPTNARQGDWIELKDGADLKVNNVTIKRNGGTIMRKTEDLVLDVRGATVLLTYIKGDWNLEFTYSDIDYK